MNINLHTNSCKKYTHFCKIKSRNSRGRLSTAEVWEGLMLRRRLQDWRKWQEGMERTEKLQILQQFINPSLHEIKKRKAAAEKAAESFLSLQWDALHSVWSPQGCLEAGFAYSVCHAFPSLCQCRAVCGVTFPTKYTQPHIWICTLHSFLALPQNPWVPAWVQVLTWARNCTGTETKTPLQTLDCASRRELSRVSMSFRWRLRLAKNPAQMRAL